MRERTKKVTSENEHKYIENAHKCTSTHERHINSLGKKQSRTVTKKQGDIFKERQQKESKKVKRSKVIVIG